jgi:hypothetical protein
VKKRFAKFIARHETESQKNQMLISIKYASQMLLPSIKATMRSATRRTNGNTMNPVTAATGQPTIKAESQRSTKSPRGPMLTKVTAALATKTMIPVARTGNTSLSFPSIFRPLLFHVRDLLNGSAAIKYGFGAAWLTHVFTGENATSLSSP